VVEALGEAMQPAEGAAPAQEGQGSAVPAASPRRPDRPTGPTGDGKVPPGRLLAMMGVTF
jgi:hypothetical protein